VDIAHVIDALSTIRLAVLAFPHTEHLENFTSRKVNNADSPTSHFHLPPRPSPIIPYAKMVRYAATAIDNGKSARARGSYLRVSFKNTRETAQAINGWKLDRALKFLENVKEHKEAVPMRRYAGSTGRCAQGTRHD
jgi:hypothetical protein